MEYSVVVSPFKAATFVESFFFSWRQRVNHLHNVVLSLGTVYGLPHASLDVLLDGSAVGGDVLASYSELLALLNHGGGDLEGDPTDPAERGVESTLGAVLGAEEVLKASGGGKDDVVGDGIGLGQRNSKAESGEDIQVVTLGGLADLSVDGDRGEGAATGNDGVSVGPLVDLDGVALSLASGVGQGEDEGLLSDAHHDVDHLLVKHGTNTSETEEGSGLHEVHDIAKGGELLGLLSGDLSTSETHLVSGKLVTTGGGDKTLSVDQVEALADISLGDTSAVSY